MLRKNTAGQHLGFGLVKTVDGTALTGATVTVYRVLDGAAQAAATGSVAEKGNGQYDFAPSQADTNANVASYLFAATGAVPVEKTVVFTAADPTNATTFGVGNLDAAVSTRLASASYTAPDNTDVVSILSSVGGTLDTKVSAVKAKTDNLPSSPAAVGSAMTLADGAITDAKFTVPTLTGLATGPVGYLFQLWRRGFKKATLNKTTGALQTYADDNTTVLTTQTLTDDGTTQTEGPAS